MPVIKLSRVVYVPDNPAAPGPGDSGGLDLGGGPIALPNGSKHCAIDAKVLGDFLDAIDARGIELEDGLERALKQYTKRLKDKAE
ncbi:hypothetical protein ACXR2U_15615 [Jatrophihabitans sp. YIM 134969]